MKTLLAVVLAATVATTAFAQEAKTSTVAALYKDKAALVGKTVQVKGKVVKVNNGIMGRNFLHIQDGTGDAATNDLTVTSKDTANVGDTVSVTGIVVVNREFGAGYAYPLLLEESRIAPAK